MVPRRSALRLTAALTVAVAILVAGCGGSSPRDPDPPATQAADPAQDAGSQATPPSGVGPRTGGSHAPGTAGWTLPAGKVGFAALATTDVTVWSAPANQDVVALFPAKQRAGVPTAFLVHQRRDEAGRRWFKVFMPRRPNESTGWVRDDQVRLVPLSHRVEIDLSERRLSLFQGGMLVRRIQVGVGRPNTPTPTGRFYVTIKLRPPEIARVYGAWALGLSGYSNVLDQFGTGNGQIALHGTSRASDLGRAVSNGCVRLDNGSISTLARLLPLGTPVTIRR
ncbi:MAG TPA: L,D-transpeptidase family protein [Actinomycetes bacterium]|jgi:lipoprotein-anchoring transpeptidase ErfK/SrfK|nr:L,D-transpeptidase family protein [Actinomycetes bacterium]